MNHEELANRLEKRLERIEEKLDNYLQVASTNKADISWVKGYIKVSLSALIAVTAGVITTIFRVFFKT